MVAAVGVLAMFGGSALVVASPASAAVPNAPIVVTTTADVIDGSDGVVSLREAVAQADADAGADTIVLASAATYDLTICDTTIDDGGVDTTSGDLVASDAAGLTINGNGATVHQTCPQRVLYASAGELAIDHLSLLDGVAASAASILAPAALLTLDHVEVSGATRRGSTKGDVGAVLAATVHISDSSIHDNVAAGLMLEGSAAAPADRLVERTSIRGNVNPDPLGLGFVGGIYRCGR